MKKLLNIIISFLEPLDSVAKDTFLTRKPTIRIVEPTTKISFNEWAKEFKVSSNYKEYNHSPTLNNFDFKIFKKELKP